MCGIPLETKNRVEEKKPSGSRGEKTGEQRGNEAWLRGAEGRGSVLKFRGLKKIGHYTKGGDYQEKKKEKKKKKKKKKRKKKKKKKKKKKLWVQMKVSRCTLRPAHREERENLSEPLD